jgi:hypothetical protein
MNIPHPPILAPHQLRVIAERDELALRLSKLRIFIDQSPQFPALCFSERKFLGEQMECMQNLLNLLNKRINLFYRQAFWEHQQRSGAKTAQTMDDVSDDSGFYSIQTETAYREWKLTVTPKDESEPFLH